MRDRLLLAAMKAVPASLAQHLMFLLRSNPAVADRWQHHIRAFHYYEPLPDFRGITVEATRRRRVSESIDFDIDAQRRQVRRLGETYGAEVQALAASRAFDFANEYFGGLDAAMYYATIRDVRPARVVEIGAGMSTRIADLAMQRNRADGHAGEIVCIEPFPQRRLTEKMPAVTLIERRVEELPLETFDALQSNDILFIDSSHAAKFGGDVCREFLDILPRLQRGVWIHVHDIFLPHDYPADWIIERRQAWNEQYLLEAFLSFNAFFKPACCHHWLWADHRDELRASWPPSIVDAGGPQGPASFWMKRVG